MKKLAALLLSACLLSFNISAQISGSISHGGLNRTYIAYLPSSYTAGSSMPLVFVLHALTMNGQRIMQVSGMNAVAEANNFIAVYPDGIGGSWNTSLPVPGASTADDVGFIDALVDEMVTLYGIDLNRVYSTGLSNGAFLSYKLACESSKCFAAVAPVAGVITDAAFGTCAPTRPVPVLHIHGTSDAIVSYTGVPGVMKSVDEVLAYWLFSNNNCSGNPTVTRLPNTAPFDLSTVDRFVWSPCDNGAEVQLLRVNGGGHQWPGTTVLLGGLGNINRDINASQEIWNFFSRFTCSQSAANPIPPAPTATAAPSIVCLGTSSVITATSPGGNYEWFNSAIAGTPIATGATFTTPPLFVSTTYWVQTTIGTDESARTPVVITVDLNPQPLAPLATALPPSLCGSGTSTLVSTVPLLGVINWYDAATGGNLLGTGPTFTTPALTATTTYWAEPSRGNCIGPRTAVTVAVNPVPAAPTATATPATVCQGNSSALTATGGTGTFTWFDSPTGGILLWVGASYTTLPLLNTTTYYVQETDANGCTSARTAVTVTVNPLPVAPTATATPASMCSGNSSTLIATAPGGTYDWYDLPIGGTLLATGDTFTTPALTFTTIYWVQTTDSNGCVSFRTPVTVTVTFAPLAPLVAALPATICAGGVSILTSTLPILGNINWYDSSAGGNLVGTGPIFTTPVLNATTTFWAEPFRGACTGPRTSVTVTVNPLPASPTAAASPATVCQGTSSTIAATGGTGTFTWFDSPTGGNLLWVGASYTTLPLLNTTTFYVQETDANGCTSARTAVTVTVNPLPVAPTATATPASMCSGNSSTLIATAPGGTYDWFNVPFGGTSLATNDTFTTPVLNRPTIFWVHTTDSNGCVSPPTAVRVFVSRTPFAPFLAARPSTICAGNTAILVARNPLGVINWYDAASGGNLLGTGRIFTTAVLTTTTTFYADITLGACTGPRSSITITVNPAPVAPTITAPASICYGATATINATAPGGLYTWYTAPTGGLPVWFGVSYTTLPLLATTTYYVQTNSQGCVSPITAVVINVDPLVIPPKLTATPSTICAGTTTTLNATVPGGTVDWYDVPFGGVPVASGTTFTTPPLTRNISFWATVTVNGCVSTRNQVNVFVTQVPAPIVTPVPFIVCTGWSSVLTVNFPLLATINWYDSVAGGNLLGTGLVFTTPPATATTTFYAEASIGGCTSARTAVTVILGPCKTDDNSASIQNENNEGSIDVYPNPTTGRIKVDFADESVTKIQLTIFDVSGKVIFTDESSPSDKNSEYHNMIDLGSFPKGVYLLRLGTDSYSMNRKIVVQ